MFEPWRLGYGTRGRWHFFLFRKTVLILSNKTAGSALPTSILIENSPEFVLFIGSPFSPDKGIRPCRSSVNVQIGDLGPVI